MKIRSITYFCNPRFPLNQKVLRRAGEFLHEARQAYEAAGYEVQTTRLASIAFPKLLSAPQLKQVPALARELDMLIEQMDVGYASLGPALPAVPQSYEVIPEAVAATRNVFFGGLMTGRGRIDLAAIRLCAEVIARCAPIDPNGFANLRFAALANVAPGSPFLPAAYHEGARPAFAIATEAADLAVDAFTGAKTVTEGRKALVAGIEKHAAALSKVARSLTRGSGSGSRPSKAATTHFGGIDFSLAPYVSERRSLGTAFERLGVARVGLHGSLAAAAILTEAIGRARFPRAGFSGLMLPVLEDATLAQRAAEGSLTVKDLLLFSAVCGTGLDTVPLPGDTTVDQLAAVLLDVAALAVRLQKPLTARLMPVPGRKAGEPTGFDFDYFSNSRVMRLDAETLSGPLGGRESFPLQAR
ncbi:MAG TPA: DUF711 family protein [Anaerolineales bacterium]